MRRDKNSCVCFCVHMCISKRECMIEQFEAVYRVSVNRTLLDHHYAMLLWCPALQLQLNSFEHSELNCCNFNNC